MGHGSTRDNVERVLEALAEALEACGHECSARDAIYEAARVYDEAGSR